MGSLDHAGSGLDVPATLDLAVSRLWDGPGGGGGEGGGEGDEGSSGGLGGWWRLDEGHRAVGSSYSDDGGVTVMLEEAVNWFCTGNATANQTQTVPIGQDVPCFTLAVPSLVLSLFAIVSLSSLVHYLFVLKPRSAPSIPEAPIHVGGKAFRRLLLALHILVFGVCLSLILPLHLPLPAWHNGLSLGVSETVWISLCSASWALSLLMLLRVHCDATRPEAELWFLTTWWSFNALACLPLVTALSNVLIKSPKKGTDVVLLVAAAAQFSVPTARLLRKLLLSALGRESKPCGSNPGAGGGGGGGGGGGRAAAGGEGKDSSRLNAYSAIGTDKGVNRGNPPPNPLGFSSWLSLITFSWCKPLLVDGFRHPLVESDLWALSDNDSAQVNAELFIRSWKRWQPSVVVAMLRAYFWPFCWCGAMTITCALLDFIGPYSVGKIIDFAMDETVPWGVCIAYVGLLTVAKLLQSVIIQHYTFLCGRLSMRLSSALKHAVYCKMLVLSPGERQRRSQGDMVNNITVDVNKVVASFLGVWNMINLPLQIGLSMYLLWRQVQWSFLAGLGAIVLLLSCNYCVARATQKHMKEVMELRDVRMKAITELLSSIKIIKLSGQELQFRDRILSIRKKELSLVWKVLWLTAVNIFLLWLAPTLVSVSVFGCYAYIAGRQLTATTVFTSVALFRLLQEPLRTLPGFISQILMAKVAIDRISSLLTAPERARQPNDHGSVVYGTTDSYKRDSFPSVLPTAPEIEQRQRDDGGRRRRDGVEGEIAVSFQGLDLSWSDDSSTPPTLRDVNIDIPNGALVLVVGRVGSGKSSLLSAMAGEMNSRACNPLGMLMNPPPPPRTQSSSGRGRRQGSAGEAGGSGRGGNIGGEGGVALAGQQPWIQNMSVRENILFGSEYDQQRYRLVVNACQLHTDLRTLPAGDRTEIGDRGVNISGGQKARLALARAMYSDADLLLLDDPLSALDSLVGQKVWERGVVGFFSGRTTVMATNKVQHTLSRDVDLVVVMHGGGGEGGGGLSVLPGLAIGGSEEAIRGALGEQGITIPDQAMGLSGSEGERGGGGGRRGGNGLWEGRRRRLVQSYSVMDGSDGMVGWEDGENPAWGRSGSFSRRGSSNGEGPAGAGGGGFVEEEERCTGRVSGKVYWQYINSVGGMPLAVGLLLIQIGWQGLQVASDWWLSRWADQSEEEQKEKTGTDIAIYAGLALGSSLFVLVRTVTVSICGLRGGRRLFRGMIHSVCRAPIVFFDTTPQGRILNRMTEDQNQVDTTICFSFGSMFAQTFSVIGQVLVTGFVTRYLLVPLIPIAVIYLRITRFYLGSSRELQRLKSISESPVISLFSSSCQGSSHIRAFGPDTMRRFVHRYHDALDANQRCVFAWLSAQQWFSLRLRVIGATVIFIITALLCSLRGSISPGLVGLAVSYALTLEECLSSWVMYWQGLENAMVAPERIHQYQVIAPEAGLETASGVQGLSGCDTWPSRGEVEFDQVVMRYGGRGEPVLKSVSFTVPGGTKLGVVGRTGAGKSSIAAALFRLVEIDEGAIRIDGIDVSTVGLHTLRRRMAIVPQESVLFAGSLRSFLDPFDEQGDDDVWDSLAQVGLDSLVQREGGLGMLLSENGDNLSAGQRQLVCLARVLLKRARVVVMDEATASMDHDTDALVQKAIRTQFHESTLIIVAHRIDTVMMCDNVLVMDAGKAIEFGPPQELLSTKGSVFSKLASELGHDKE